MNKEVESRQEVTKPSKGKFWRNIWLISILAFIVSIPIMVAFTAVGSVEAGAGIGGLVMILSVPVGVISFLLWVFHSGSSLVKRIVKTAVFGFLGLFGLWLFASLFLVQPEKIYGHSMEPIVKDGEYVLVDKITYRFSQPKRGEVVDYVKDNEERIGRIIGLPNEAVQIKPGEVRINDKAINEPYADWSNWAENREQQVPLKDNEYLVLLDRRSGNNQIVKK